MARGDKNYSEVTHKASKKGTKERIKAVHDMVGYKKKLHEMVEALIGGDSKTAAAALHEYLQAKTRVILGEMDMEGEEHGEEFGGDDLGLSDDEEHEGDEEFDGHEDHDEEGECPECHCDPCECDEDGEEHEDHDELDFGGDHEGHEEHDEEDFPIGEGVKNFPKGGSLGSKSSSSGIKKTAMKKHGNSAKGLEPKVKGHNNFETTAKSGSKKSNSTEATKPFKGAHNNAAKDLGRKVKGTLNFEKSSGVGTKSDSSGAKKTSMKKFGNNAPDLAPTVKGKNKFD